MQNDSRANHADASDKRRKGDEQFPVDVKVLLGISLENETLTILRVAVMGDLMTNKYSSYREYHAFNEGASITDVNGFVLRSEILDRMESAIDAFLAPMSTPLDIPQVVNFQRGVVTSTAPRKRLFKATDPDDNTRMIGCLLEQNELGGLQRVTWYKTTNSPSVFQAIPKSLTFTAVKNANGEPSTDPNDIGGWAWYHSTGNGIGLSAPPT